MYGMHDYVERMLDTMLHYQKEDGLYYQACGLQDHGGLLSAIAAHYQMTGRTNWLKRVAPQVVKACEWLILQRAEAPREGIVKGLIKFRPYNDAQEPAYNYLGNAEAAVGLAAIAEALKDVGMAAEGAKYAAESIRYRQDMLESMKASIFEHQGMRILPLEPDTHRIEKLSQYRGGDYYGLVASQLLQTGILTPFDQRACCITDIMEKRKGMVAGVCEFMEGIDHAYTYGYLMTQMQRDDIKKVLLGFWSMFAFGMTRETYSPVEVSHILTGENHLTLPHTYSLTEQLRLLRNMLVWEDGEVLKLAHAIPRNWLERGKCVAANDAPTKFGPVSYSITSNKDGSMSVHLVPPNRHPPATITLRLRHPQHKSASSVKGATSLNIKITRDLITITNIPSTASTADFIVHFK
jgi:hypothetical protein